MSLETIKRVERFTTYVLLLIVGVLGVLLYQQYSQLSAANTKVEKLTADVRTAVGKLYDLQEKQDDEATAKEGALHVQLYELEQKLLTCKKD